jgi:hypothetical protein
MQSAAKTKVNVFSTSEKDAIMQEFEHYNQRKEKERGAQDSDGGK